MAYRNKTSLFYSVSHRLITTSSTKRSNEHLKNITKPETIPTEYWRRILSVAQHLKKQIKNNGKQNLKLLSEKHVTLLFVKPHGRFQLAFTLACDLLGARKTVYCDWNFENQPSPGDAGKVLSSLTDMLVTHGLHHEALIKMVSNSPIPVFSASSDLHCLQKALSDMMTFTEAHDNLQGLTVAWIGPPNSLFNSYMVLCNKFGLKFRYNLICRFGSGEMSPVRMLKLGFDEEDTCTLGYKNVEECIAGAHIVATSKHPDESNKITLDLLKSADPNWIFVHSLPRSFREVSDDVFNHERNLSWRTSENYLYVAMAFLLTSLDNSETRGCQ